MGFPRVLKVLKFMFGFFRPLTVLKLDIGAEKVMKKSCILFSAV